jgi:SNF2 family DNA or RNA helicase
VLLRVDRKPEAPVPSSPPSLSGQDQGSAVADAGHWLLDVDRRAVEELRKVGSSTRPIPTFDPAPLPRPASTSSVHDVGRLRQTSPVLIRPRLLNGRASLHLLPYQAKGVSWLISRRRALLADEMGLGKTIQGVAAIRELIGEGLIRWALVVCPASLTSNWEAEFSRWAPELSRVTLSPAANLKDDVWAELTGRVHVLITTFDHLRTPPRNLSETSLPLLVLDEAHRARNASSGIFEGLRTLRLERCWAFTGTPVERDARDLATLLSLVDSGRFAPSDAGLPVSVLRAKARDLTLRRRRDDVLEDLPKAEEHVDFLSLSPQQQTRYRAVRIDARNRPSRAEEALRLLNELRDICDIDPVTLASSKLNRAEELLVNIRQAGEKAVVFSTRLLPLTTLAKRLSSSDVGFQFLDGSVKATDRSGLIQRFRREPDVTALLATIWVAGEGLTLTEANHAIFLSEWWNPSTNRQARDRLVRIGQTRKVKVYRFICSNTVEEALVRVLDRKAALYSGLVDGLARSQPSPSLVKEVLSELDALDSDE